MPASINNIFTGQVTPKDLTKYTLYRGVTDFSELQQFNMFEGGYSFLHVLDIPKFLKKLAEDQNSGYKSLIETYRHYLEYAFKGLSGFEDITADTGEVNNGVSNLQLINKVNMQSASQFSMTYTEQHGLLLAKVHELFLRGVKDPKTGVKRYHGLLNKGGSMEGQNGFEQEVFTFLYYVCDNTCLNIEKAYLIVAAQPTTAALGDVSNSERGQFDWKEVTVQFNGIPLVGPAITAKAQQFLDYINEHTVFDEMKFGYQALKNMPAPGSTGTPEASSSEVQY